MNKQTIKENLIQWMEENPDMVREAIDEVIQYLKRKGDDDIRQEKLDNVINEVFEKYGEVLRHLA